MPSVFTIEGLSAAQLASINDAPPIVARYPPYGGPFSPHAAYNVGLTRPPTLVFNAQHLVQEPPRVKWPERGPITDYGAQYEPLLMNHPYVNLGNALPATPSNRRDAAIAVMGIVGVLALSAAIGTALGKR